MTCQTYVDYDGMFWKPDEETNIGESFILHEMQGCLISLVDFVIIPY